MIPLDRVIIVEGKYDANRVKQIFDAPVIDTAGFGIFSDGEKLSLIRAMAARRGIVILTDPDGAGFVIRNYLKGAIAEGKVFHAYAPDIKGKERRKHSAAADGLLGVEGIPDAAIIEAVRASGAMDGTQGARRRGITKGDMYEMGLSGGERSAGRRAALCAKLGLPARIGANALCDILDIMTDVETLRQTVAGLEI